MVVVAVEEEKVQVGAETGHSRAEQICHVMSVTLRGSWIDFQEVVQYSVLHVLLLFLCSYAKTRAPYIIRGWKRVSTYNMYITMQSKLYISTLHHTTPHLTTPHYPIPCHTTMYNTTLHHSTPHHITPHYTTPQHTTQLHTTLLHTTLHLTIPFHAIPQCTTLHYTTAHHTFHTTTHHTTLHFTTLHHATLNFTTPHHTTYQYDFSAQQRVTPSPSTPPSAPHHCKTMSSMSRCSDYSGRTLQYPDPSPCLVIRNYMVWCICRVRHV